MSNEHGGLEEVLVNISEFDHYRYRIIYEFVISKVAD